jgi:hypothetical protein
VPLQTATSSSLVRGGAGAHAMATQAPPVKVRALRAFLIQGKRVEVGTSVDVPKGLAVELIGANKAEIARPQAPSAPPSAKSEPKGNQP